MDTLKKQLRRFAQEESGQDIIEYCLMLVFVALAVAAGTPSIKDQVSKVFSEAVSALT
jgi:Flp pilus assembly pilin Flp